MIRFKPSASKLVIGRWYPNHSRGKERNAKLFVGDIMLTPLSPDLLARAGVAEMDRVVQSAVGNEVNKITRNGSANQLVKTGTDGSIWIQSVAVTDQHHATNKAYVDGAVRDKADKSYVDSKDAEVRAYVDSRVPIPIKIVNTPSATTTGEQALFIVVEGS